MKDFLAVKFKSEYGTDDGIRFFHAPGRVNLIGEHLDYNGGHVLPAAISLGISAAVRPNDSGILRFASLGMEERGKFSVSGNLDFKESDAWLNFPKGVAKMLRGKGVTLHGGDFLFMSTLPVGSGLSSSACIEVLVDYILRTLGNAPTDRVQIALECKKVENEYIGVNCGIMDQYAVANGKKDHAMLLDCGTLACEHIPVQTGDYRFIIMNSNKKRTLAESDFNVRFKECEEGLFLVKQIAPGTEQLASASLDVLKHIKDENLKKRIRHVITEEARVRKTTGALANGDAEAIGQLLNESHFSLRDDYEVTGHALDSLTNAARNHPACTGARMTGAGFGGCCIALVHKDGIEDFMEKTELAYHLDTGLKATFMDTLISEGVKEE